MDTPKVLEAQAPYKLELVWRNILIFIFLHYASVAVFFLDFKKETVAIG